MTIVEGRSSSVKSVYHDRESASAKSSRNGAEFDAEQASEAQRGPRTDLSRLNSFLRSLAYEHAYRIVSFVIIEWHITSIPPLLKFESRTKHSLVLTASTHHSLLVVAC